MTLCFSLTTALNAQSDADPAPENKIDIAYTFQTIDLPEATATYAFGINNQGELVGRIGDEETGDAWVRGRNGLETFDFPGAGFTEAFEITENGDIVGWFTDHAGMSHGFVRDRGGVFSQIDVPGSAWTIALAGTNRGEVAGFYGDPVDGDVQHGFVRDRAGNVIAFSVPGAIITQPFGMNEAGVIVGVFSTGSEERGFYGTLLGTIVVVDYPDVDTSALLGVSNAGTFIGFLEDGFGVHGYLWNGEDQFRSFDVPVHRLPCRSKSMSVDGSSASLPMPTEMFTASLLRLVEDTSNNASKTLT